MNSIENMEQEISIDNSIHYLAETGQINAYQYIALRQCERDEEKVELLQEYLDL